jgi:Peroxiredoxin
MRSFLAILVFALAAFSCQSAKDEYSIKGSIDGLDKGKVYLQKIVNGQPKTVDSTDISGGKFSFKGKVEVPDFRVLRLNDREYFAQFFLDNANISVAVKKDSLNATKITGSPTNDVFKAYVTEMDKMSKEVAALQGKYQSAMASNDQEAGNKAKIDYQALVDNNKVFTKNFIKEHTSSVVSAFILLQFAAQLESNEVEEMVGKFAPEIGKSEYVTQLKEYVNEQKKTAIGAVAPDFTMNDTEGKPVSLASFKGKIVLVDFWASWCGPCRQENPNVVRLYQQYHGKGFEILGVSLDRGKEEWLKAIKDDGLAWTHVSDLKYWQNAAARLYGVNSIPQSFLLDKDGKIIAKGLRGEELANKLAALFPN